MTDMTSESSKKKRAAEKLARIPIKIEPTDPKNRTPLPLGCALEYPAIIKFLN